MHIGLPIKPVNVLSFSRLKLYEYLKVCPGGRRLAEVFKKEDINGYIMTLFNYDNIEEFEFSTDEMNLLYKLTGLNIFLF